MHGRQAEPRTPSYRHVTRDWQDAGGKKRALVATGNQLLKIVYHMLKNKTHYKELGVDYVDDRRKSHLIRHHLDALKTLGVDMPGTPSA